MMQAKFSVRISAQRRMGAVLASVVVFSSLCAPALAHAQRGATPTPSPVAVDAAARCISDTGPLIPATPGKVNYRTAPRASGALVNAPLPTNRSARHRDCNRRTVDRRRNTGWCGQRISEHRRIGSKREECRSGVERRDDGAGFSPDGKTSIPCVPETLIPAKFGPVAYTYDERGQVYAQVDQTKVNPDQPPFMVFTWGGQAWQGAPTGGSIDSATSADVSGQAVEMVRSEELPEWFGGFGLDLTGYPDVQGHLNPKYAGAFFDNLVTAIAYQQSTLRMVDGRPEISPAELLKMLEETNGVMQIVIPAPDPASEANFQETIPTTAEVDLSKGVVFGFAPYEDGRVFRIGQVINQPENGGTKQYITLGVSVVNNQLKLLMYDYPLVHLGYYEERSHDAILEGKMAGSVEAALGAGRVDFYNLLLQIMAVAPQGGHSPEAGQARGVRDTTGASITFLINGRENFPQQNIIKELISTDGLYTYTQGEVWGYDDSLLTLGTIKE